MTDLIEQPTATTATTTARERRSANLVRAGFAVVIAVYVFAMIRIAQDGPDPIWLGVAAANCVAAAILLFSRGYQVAIAGPVDGEQGG